MVSKDSDPRREDVAPRAHLGHKHEGVVPERAVAARRDELLRELERLETELTGAREAHPEHGPSAALEALERAKRDRIDALAAVERAFARAADGEYGICSDCGRPIDPGRLELIPEAELCAPCARHREVSPGEAYLGRRGACVEQGSGSVIPDWRRQHGAHKAS